MRTRLLYLSEDLTMNRDSVLHFSALLQADGCSTTLLSLAAVRRLLRCTFQLYYRQMALILHLSASLRPDGFYAVCSSFALTRQFNENV